MAVEILEGRVGGLFFDGEVRAVWFCNTTGFAFGPVFGSLEEAASVLAHINHTLGMDARKFVLEHGIRRVQEIILELRAERGQNWFCGSYDEYDRPVEVTA